MAGFTISLPAVFSETKRKISQKVLFGAIVLILFLGSAVVINVRHQVNVTEQATVTHSAADSESPITIGRHFEPVSTETPTPGVLVAHNELKRRLFTGLQAVLTNASNFWIVVLLIGTIFVLIPLIAYVLIFRLAWQGFRSEIDYWRSKRR